MNRHRPSVLMFIETDHFASFYVVQLVTEMLAMKAGKDPLMPRTSPVLGKQWVHNKMYLGKGQGTSNLPLHKASSLPYPES